MIDCEKERTVFPAAAEILEKAEGVCPVEWAGNIASLAASESCGRCVMCREGTLQLSAVIGDLMTGKGESDDAELILDICSAIEETASCDQARDAAKLIRLSLETHREEWDNHRRKRCAALKCKAYTTVAIDPETCVGCGACVAACPEGAIAGQSDFIHVVNADRCTRCGACLASCPHGSIAVYGAALPKLPEEPVPVGSFAASAGRRRRRDRA